MPPKAAPIPRGYHTLTPYLIVSQASSAIDFYRKALGASELFRIDGPDGRIGHAELKVGDSRFMLADEFPEMGAKGPKSVGGCPVTLLLYVEDVDHLSKQAVMAGMKMLRPVKNQFYGDRSGTFEDPYGHIWTIATHIEDVSPAEMKKRAAAEFGA